MARQDKILGTKIYKDKFETIKNIAEKSGFTIYRFLQIILDCFYKCFCDGEPITEETREVISKFIDIERAKKGFSLIAPIKGDLRFSKCLAIININGKEIPEILLIEKDGDNITQNLNRDQILIEFLQAFSPHLLRVLQTIKETEKTRDLTDALYLAVSPYSLSPEERLHNEIIELFEDENDIVISPSSEFPSLKKKPKNANLENLSSGAFENIGKYKRTYNKSYLIEDSPKTKRNNNPDPLDFSDSFEEYEEENYSDIE